MFVLGNFISAATEVLDWVLTCLQWVIFIRVVLSWVNADPYNPIVRGIITVVEPFLRPFRRLLPPWKTGGIDWSPVCAFLAILFLKRFLILSLLELASRLK